MSSPSRQAAEEPSLRAYERLHAHAERELELAGGGDIESLLALGAHWDALIADLPEQPPRAAAQLLERARLIHERTRVELLRLRDALLTDLAHAGRARRTADGYAGQLRRRRRLDRSV